jgi:hypothetical protein
VIAAVTLLGIAVDFSPRRSDPRAILERQHQGFVAGPIMAAMMWVAGRRTKGGSFSVPLPLQMLGWMA